MSNGTATPAEKPPDFKAQGEELGIGFTDPVVLSRFGKGLLSGLQEFLAWVVEFLLKNAGRLAVYLAKTIARGEDAADPVFRQLTDQAIQDLTGAPAGGNPGAVGRQLLNAMTGGAGAPGAGELQPSLSGAEAYMESVMKLALEGYLEGSLFHALSLGYLEKFGELDDILANVLGLSRATRAVMRPILQARVVTPATWQVNKTYRPELLGASEVARQVARGRMTRDDAFEELARQGYSDTRIEALLSTQRKFLGVDDLFYEVHAGLIPLSEAVTTLREQGYDEQTASKEINLRILKRLDAIRNDVVSPAISAYVARRISDAELDGALEIAIDSASERREYQNVARARRALNQKSLSPSETRACVLAGILDVRDYRDALTQDGYDPGAVLALELLLRKDLAEDREIEEKRRKALEERERVRAQREADALARREELERRRALDRRGDEADLEAAAIRGLIPIARVEELYAARYDADTAAIYVALLEERRETYLEEQRRRADAVKRAGGRALSIADLEEAVLANQLDFARYRSRLDQLGFTAEDAEILVRTLEARKAALDAARAARERATTAARQRSIDLPRYERLVRRGVRSLEQYGALLAELDFDEGSIAAMRELLELQIADDAAARQAREDAEARLRAKGLSLEQLRRLVVLGLAEIAQFEQLLIAEGFTADAQILLLAELRLAVADAEDARRRRDESAARVDTRELPLATAARAARLGLISPAAYEDRLVRAGYNPEDVAIEMDLLLTEIANVQATRQLQEGTSVPAGDQGLSLTVFARAVRAGLKTLAEYRARAIELRFTADAVETLVRLLADELQETQAAKERRETLGVELAGQGISLAELEAAVRDGSLTLDGFVEELQRAGLAPEDAELLAALLADSLEG